MTLHRALSAAAALAAFAGPVALVACGASDSHPVAEEGVGKVRADLSATGPDGATYTLPATASLQLTPVPADAGAATTLQFNQGVATETFSVPAGQYTAILQGQDMNGHFTLGRAGDGGATSAVATLTDVLPYNINVPSGGAANLQFHFQLAGIGNVTFGTGQLNTSIGVAASEGGAASTGNMSLTPITFAQVYNGGFGNQAITNLANTALGTAGSVSFMDSVQFSLTGPFAIGFDSTCAPISVAGGVKPSGNGINDLFNEAMGGTGTLCLYDGNGYNLVTNAKLGTMPPSGNFAGAAVLTFTRTGAPQTSTVMSALADAGAGPFTFTDIVIGSPNPFLYNGTTASLSSLQGGVTMGVTQAVIEFDPNTDIVGVGLQGSKNMTLSSATLTLSP
jgi:hypothetical protein